MCAIHHQDTSASSFVVQNRGKCPWFHSSPRQKRYLEHQRGKHRQRPSQLVRRRPRGTNNEEHQRKRDAPAPRDHSLSVQSSDKTCTQGHACRGSKQCEDPHQRQGQLHERDGVQSEHKASGFHRAHRTRVHVRGSNATRYHTNTNPHGRRKGQPKR